MLDLEQSWKSQLSRLGWARLGKLPETLRISLKNSITDFLVANESPVKNNVWRDKSDSDHRLWGLENYDANILDLKNYLTNIFDDVYGTSTENLFLAQHVRSGPQSIGSGPKFHRDSFRRQYKAFVFLTPTDINNGALEVVKNSHRPSRLLKEFVTSPFRRPRVTQPIMFSTCKSEVLNAQAGEVFIVDTSLIHKGNPCQKSDRVNLTLYSFKMGAFPAHIKNSEHNIANLHSKRSG